ncbi:hypothetical protein GOV13_02240 [Candidatus Pacearchaeota archaeon]|nr:hypothetical protein [Candidatus Pacearchaeota archaeon]
MAYEKEEISWIRLNKIIEEEGILHLILCLKALVMLRRSKKVYVVRED